MLKNSIFWKYRRNFAQDQWDNFNYPHRNLILEELKKIQWESLLEVGCGAGPNLRRINDEFEGVKLAGADINEECIEFGRKMLPDVSWVLTDAIALPFEDKSFDVVLSDAVLIYANPERVETMISEMKRVAKKAIILCEWHDDSLNKFGTPMAGHWVRNYIKLLGGGETIKITNWPDGDEDWNKLGHIIVYNL